MNTSELDEVALNALLMIIVAIGCVTLGLLL